LDILFFFEGLGSRISPKNDHTICSNGNSIVNKPDAHIVKRTTKRKHMGELTFRTVKSSDISNIMMLEDTCFNEQTRESENVYRGRIEHFPQGFMIMEYEGRFIGAISSEIWKRDLDMSTKGFTLGHSIAQGQDISGDELYVSSMGILPEFSNKGYGTILFRALIDNVVKEFKNVKYGILIVNQKWTNAQRIYRRNGFYETGAIPGFFTESDDSRSDGIIMRHDSIADLCKIQ